MRYYTGLDISMKETAVCIMNEKGAVMKESVVPTDPASIHAFIQESKFSITQVGLESGCLSHWLVKELRELGLPTICVDARHIAAVLATTINKTDKNDARGIANALRCNMYKEVHTKSIDSLERSTLLASRRALIEQRTYITNTIRGLLKSYGIRLSCSATTNMFIPDIRKKILELPSMARFGLEELLKCAESLHEQIKNINKVVKKLAQEIDLVQLLQTIPGIGPVTAMNFLMEIDNPFRFQNSRSVGAYVGMTPTQYSSGETHRQGRISKCGSKELRHLLMEAGFVIITRTEKWSKLKAWGMKIMKRSGLKKAAVAVGRKLAIIMHRMMMTGEPFRYGDQKPEEKVVEIASQQPCLLSAVSA